MELRCIAPTEGAEVELVTEQMKEWFALGGSTDGTGPTHWLSLRRQGEDRSFAREIEFCWDAPATARCVLHLEPAGGRSWEREVIGCRCGVSGLEIGRAYTWYVTSGEQTSAPSHFVTAPDAPRVVTVDGVSNVRDMGGWSVRGGRIRQNMLYRGGELETHMTVTEEGLRVLTEDLGIRTDVDLRREANLVRSPIPGAELAKLGMDAYSEMVEQDAAVVRAFFDLLLLEDAYPMYIHCWGGADRTGCLCFLLGAMLGMTEADLFRDYELTSLSIWGERSVKSELFTQFVTALRKFGDEGDDTVECAVKFLRASGVEQWQMHRLRELLVEKEYLSTPPAGAPLPSPPQQDGGTAQP